jgi:hypothetical protein
MAWYIVARICLLTYMKGLFIIFCSSSYIAVLASAVRYRCMISTLFYGRPWNVPCTRCSSAHGTSCIGKRRGFRCSLLNYSSDSACSRPEHSPPSSLVSLTDWFRRWLPASMVTELSRIRTGSRFRISALQDLLLLLAGAAVAIYGRTATHLLAVSHVADLGLQAYVASSPGYLHSELRYCRCTCHELR